MKKYLIIFSILCLIATVAFAVDTTYGPKVYKDSGGDRQVVASGGEVLVETGGILTFGGTSLTGASAALITTTGAATLTNKTLSGATFTGTIAGGTFTGSTLTTPVIASFYQDTGKTQLMTAPNTTSDTLAAIAATQTLTNKTLTSPVVNWGISPKTFTAGEDWTLSAAEAKSVLLTLASGSGTPSIIDGYSAAGTVKIVRNAANIAVTLKMNGQTGVSVASGKTAVLINSGTDYVRVTADATH